MKKLLSYFLGLFLLVPFALAATTTLQQRFSIFVNGFRGIGAGGINTAALVAGFIAILPVVGLVVIVFGLMFFITKISIFKSPEHDRYARMIAFGVALIGLAQQSVYNTILGLSTSFLILVFILAVVFIFIMFVNYNRKAHLESYTELHKITGQALSAKQDLSKIKNELRHEQNLRDKTDRDLEILNTELNSTNKLVGDELSQVDRLADLLRKATAAYQTGNSPAVNQYVTALSKDLGSLITTMQHEQNHNIHIADMVSKIEAELAKWGHSNSTDKTEEEHLQKLFHKFSQTWGHEIKDDELKKLYKEEHGLISHLQHIRRELHQLQSLYDKIIAQTEDLNRASYQTKHLEANAVRDNIMNQQFAEAHKHLDNLRAIIEHEPHVIKQLRSLSQEMHRLISRVDEEEKKMNALIKSKMIKTLTKIRKQAKDKEEKEKEKEKGKKDKEKEEVRHFNRQRSTIESWVQDIRSHLHQLQSIAYPYRHYDEEYEEVVKGGKQKAIRQRDHKEVLELLHFLQSEDGRYHEYLRSLHTKDVNLIDKVNALHDMLRGTHARLVAIQHNMSGNLERVFNQMKLTIARLNKLEEHLAQFSETLKKEAKGKDKEKDAWDKAQDTEYTVLQ